jgi:sulfatase maturation enzyme AslB (radical SAM superfamily)
MRIKKIIMWELSLKCNLSCDFCYQEDRRNLQVNQITIKDAEKIIENIPNDYHIAFI